MTEQTSVMKLNPIVEEGELDAQQQAYLNTLLQEEKQDLAKLLKRNNSPHNDLVEHYLSGATSKIQRELDGGKLELGEGSSKPIEKSRQRVMEIEMKKRMLQKQLGYLNTQIRSYPQNAQEHSLKPTPQISREEHHKLIKKMFKLHQQYEQLHKRNLAEMEEKQKEEEERRKAETDQQRKKEQQEKRKRLEENLRAIKDQQEKRNKLQEEANARFEEVKQKKFLHQRMEERYEKEIVMPTLQLKKKKLREIRQFRRPLSIEELKNHQEEYEKSKAEHQFQRKNEVPKYQPPAKSTRLGKLLEEEELQRHKAEEEKKKQLEEKMERAESYCLYLKQNFKPKVDEEKRREIQQRLQKEKSRSKEERINTKMIGLGYLEYSKQRHKVVSREERNGTPLTNREHATESANMSYQSKASSGKPHNYLTTRDRKDYDEERKKKLDRIIGDKEMNRTEKVKELKAHAELLTEMANRKNALLKVKPNEANEVEATELLLASIRAKMGIIDVYKANGQQ